MQSPPEMALKFAKMSGSATTHGQDFEVNLAALLFLRGLNSDLDFQLGTNVKGAGAMDDLVYRFKRRQDTCWTTLYVQLKHKASKPVSRQMLQNPKGDFALPKYFQSYREIKESMSSAVKQTLFDGSFEQCVFVIFTNAKANDSLGEGRCEDLSLAEEFLWTDSGSVYSFEGDDDMLQCLGESGDDGRKFLSRLRVFCDQPRVARLKAAVRDELYKVTEETVRGVDVARLCDAFLVNVKAWWEKSSDILHRGHDLLRRAVEQIRLESSCQKTLIEFKLDVEFKDQALLSLRRSLASDLKVFVFKSSENSFRLSLTKLLQAIGGQALVLDSQGLLANRRALLAQWRSGDSKSLVICTEDWSSGNAEECCQIVRDVCQIRKASSLWNVVFCTGKTEVSEEIHKSFPECKSITSENFLFSQLCKESRESVLAKKVAFQGCDVSLRQILCLPDENVDVDLDAYLDAPSVEQVLASRGGLSVGSALAPGVDFYVDRSLGRATVVQPSLFHEGALRETVTVRVMRCEAGLAARTVGKRLMDSDSNNNSGLVEMALLYLSSLKDFRSIDLKNEEIIQDLNQSRLVLDKSGVFIGPKCSLVLFECNSVGLRFGQNDAVTALRVRTSKLVWKEACFLFVSDKTNAQDVRKLSDFVQSKHLLSLENGQLRWLESHGDIESIRPHIDQDRVVRFAPETAMDVEDRLVLVCAEPGMGKSTLMTRLAQNTKTKHPHCFVVLLALNDHTQLFAEDRQKDALDFLSTASKIDSPLQKALLKFALEVSGNVVLLLDGFDEIAPTYVDQSCNLLSRLNKESKATKIWMTSRNSIKLILENHISMFSGKLLEFCEDDQRSFLSKFWADKSTMSKTELDQVIVGLLSRTSQSIKDERVNFLGVPLQTRMLAEVCEALLTGSGDKSTLPDKLDLLGLLEKFVEQKCSIFVQAKLKIPTHDTNYEKQLTIMKKEFIENHSKASLMLLLDDGDLKLLDMKWIICESSQFFKDLQSGTDKTGFIDGIVNGKPRFVHRVYAEFFVAKWISEHLKNNRELIATKMFIGDFAVVRNIFDRILSRDSALHTAVLDEDREAVRTLLGREDVDVQAQDGGGRTALHLAASRGTSEDREENKRRGEILDLLIDKTSDLDQVDNVLGVSPLSYADVTQSWYAIDKLLRCTRNKEQLNLTSVDTENQGMLDNIFEMDLDNLLGFCLNTGLAVEAKTVRESELFFSASKHGCLKVATLLLERNADTNKSTSDKKTQTKYKTTSNKKVQNAILFFENLSAKRNNNLDAINFINMQNENGITAIHLAAQNGHTDCIRFLISQGGDPRSRGHYNVTPLHLAAFYKHPGAVRVLLEAVDDEDRAAAVNSCDNDGDSVLMCGALGGCVECVAFLVQAGGKLTHARDDGWTPLMTAAQKGHLEVVSYLLLNFNEVTEGMSKMEYVNMFTKDGNTAIHLAAENGHSNCIRFLISQGGDPRNCNHDKSTPLHKAAFNKHPGAVRVLLEAADDEDRAAAVNSCDKYGDSVLMSGALGGCVECVGLLVQAGGKLTQAMDDGGTPLMAAAQEGHMEVVSYLLHNFNEVTEGMSKMEYVNMFTKDGYTAIHIAAQNGHSDCIRFLISQGGDPRSRNHDNITPLHWALHPGAVRVLLEAVDDEDRAAAVNSCNKNGVSVLMCGALRGCVECVGLLVQAGGKLTQADNNLRTPLMFAALKGHLEVVSYLLHNFNKDSEGMSKMDYVNMFTKVGNTAIHLAALNGHSDCIRFLISHGGDPRSPTNHNSTPLHLAAENKHPGAVRVLLEAVDDEDRAAAVNSCNKYGTSVLTRGAWGGCVECVGLLVQAGGKLTQARDDGWTPLMAAAVKGHLEVVSYLLHNFNEVTEGMSKMEYVNMFDKNGNTAIHLAAENGHTDVITVLISQGGDPRSRNHNNSTPLHFAAFNKHPGAVRVLLEAVDDEDRAAAVNSCVNDGASVLMRGAFGGCVECVGLLVQAGGKLTQAKGDGGTPLMAAAEKGHMEVVSYLLHNFNEDIEGMSKMDYVNMFTKDGNTAIHLAAENGHTDVITVLISQGGDPRSRNHNNPTPLNFAALNKHPGAVGVLLEAVDDEDRAAAVNSCDKYGQSVLMWGAFGGCVECVGLLVQAGGKLTQARDDGWTPLMAAAVKGHLEVVSYLLHNFNEVTEGMSKMEYVNMFDKNGNTAIHFAAESGHSDCVRLLISQGGDPRSRNHDNSTPLHFAAYNKHPGAVRVLLEAVDDEDRASAVNSCDNDGDSVLMCGALGGCVECVGLLVQAGGKLTQARGDGGTPLMVAAQEGHMEVVSYLLHNFNKDIEGMNKIEYVNMFTKDGATAIHYTAEIGHSDCIRFLISQGGDPQSRNHDNSTPLHFAAFNKHPGAVRVLLEAVDDEDRAAAVNSCNNDRNSVLMLGALGGCVECVGLLVQAGGKLTQADNSLRTPLMAAAMKGHLEVVSYLLRAFDQERDGTSLLVFINMSDKDGNTAIDFATTAECRLAIEDALSGAVTSDSMDFSLYRDSDAMGHVTCGLWRRGVHGFPCLFGANRSLVRTSCPRFAYFKLPTLTGGGPLATAEADRDFPIPTEAAIVWTKPGTD